MTDKPGQMTDKPGQMTDKPGQMTDKPVWEKKNPKKTSTPLTSAKKSSAKKMAAAAGRPYPNLVDNMRAAKAAKKKGA